MTTVTKGPDVEAASMPEISEIPEVPEKGRRLSPDERRSQLVATGLRLAKSESVNSLAAAEVAEAAGVSKGLVFHYFPTQGDLHAAIARAGADELVELLSTTDDSLPDVARLTQGLDRFIAYIEQQPNTFASFARNARGDTALGSVFEDTRNQVVDIIGSVLGVETVSPRLRLFLRGWIASVEELTLDWLNTHAIERDELIAVLEHAAYQFLAWATGASSVTPD